jgi:hypothetical protein
VIGWTALFVIAAILLLGPREFRVWLLTIVGCIVLIWLMVLGVQAVTS